MSDAEAARLEEELFAAPDAPEVLWLDAMARLAAHIESRGTYEMGITRAAVDAAMRSGRRVAFVDLGRGGPDVVAQFPRSAEQIITRVECDFGDIERLDCEIEIPGHGIVKTIRDIAFDRENRSIYAYCEASLAQLAVQARSRSHLIGYRGNERRELAVIEVKSVLVD